MRQIEYALAATAILLGGAALIGVPTPVTAGQVPAGTPSRGEQLYVSQGCYQCHGHVGQGSIMSGPALIPATLSSTAFRAYVRNPNGAMPPYTAKVLSDADLAAIESHVRALPIGRPVSEIAQLARFGGPAATARSPQSQSNGAARKPIDLAIGKKLYGQSCAMCHGANREGGIGPDLRAEVRKRDLAATINLIITPPAKMPKLSPNPLSRDQVRHVASYIRDGR